MSLFEIAARKKFRFPSIKGDLVAEQLFDLPLQSEKGFSLNDVAIAIHNELKTQTEPNFVNTGTNPRKVELETKLALVVHVIETKKAENAAAADNARRNAEREQLVEILNDKKKSELLGLSAAEIEQRIAALIRFNQRAHGDFGHE